ncbi:phosphate starvation-inducible protein [Agrobacterium phage Atu_ph04]|uniref:Phosphate starvation-inducible protein n=1 Tax=Agrobacterium phage Atu_ph04 TaxID=2024263 RepID=A0A223VZP4_9CAUD|nr:PhoH-like phosphate starvation-inducible [Agrobacterium phage Atu_ph04]ASV44642.1 phosphate starvation-inducible protein [Agrobacterium phage Atu_ph04]
MSFKFERGLLMAKKQTASSNTTQSSALTRFVHSQASFHTRPKHDDIVISARNPKQKLYLKSLMHNKFTIGVGPAGCGKTYLPTLVAAKDLVDEKISKIVIVRPSVEVEGENEIGALPGDIIGKFGPQVKAVTDTLEEYFGRMKLLKLLENEVIEIIPVAFIRGRSLKNARVIVDEAQNLSTSGMKAILTRIGENCKYAICGDIEQTDRPSNNGLSDLIARVQKAKETSTLDDIEIVGFNETEVEREESIKSILRLYSMSL